jgi:proteasome accessory factor C
MAKEAKNINLERTARLLTLVPYLLTHQGISIEKLAMEFAVTQTQLLEDLNTLWMCGLPGYTPLELIDLSFDSGYVTIWNAETLQRPRSLSKDEALTLVLGLGYLLDELEESESELSLVLRGLIAKLASSVDAPWPNKVHVGTLASPIVRGMVNQAIADRTAVVISYHSMARDELSERVIHPLELRIENENEYLLAYCELSAGYRTFRLDRILSIIPTQSQAEPPLADPVQSEPKILAEIAVESRLRDVFERFRVPARQATGSQGLQITVEGYTPNWLHREIMSFGGEVHLISPKLERDLLRQRAERALSAYQSAP